MSDPAEARGAGDGEPDQDLRGLCHALIDHEMRVEQHPVTGG
jgi:hypothetical protein